MKAEIDEHRQPGRFLLTGSTNVLMLSKIADALPGRMEIVELWPLSQGEIDNRPVSFIDAVFEPVLRPLGSPAVSCSTESCAADFRSRCSVRWTGDRTLTAVVEREVRDLSNVGSVAEQTTMIWLSLLGLGRCSNLADVARGGSASAQHGPQLLRPAPGPVFLVVDVLRLDHEPHNTDSFGHPSYS